MAQGLNLVLLTS